MFGGFAAPQFSEEEIEAYEAVASFTIQSFLAAAVTLYLCMFCPPLSSLLRFCCCSPSRATRIACRY
ncbi:hypothetical protein GGS23DRAFT_578773 [Durotheca rogersii]|uniref:uncharacterized protein n=1 Tax=Durotheca rogersii TaxID=419775 RepID=UPI00221E4D23|nr:uncharacterized protein GGS23DRAFT_578773 [Durotheca rogersii]KAI5861102.1 hypothetical protein GGS23DRAFT_578773 [Durotheca rogersii]